jgi:O-succinylbenzoic acid--CoA ligase
MERAMDLIICDGQPTDLLKLYPEESHWVDLWLSDRSEFEFQTSGSTGPPKTILFSRSQIIKSAERTARIFDWHPGMNAIHSLPMSFVAGRMNILRALICHQSLWRIDPKINFTLEDFSLDIKISWWTLTPAMLDKVIRMPSLNLQHATLLVGGGRLSEKIMDMAKGQKFPIWESYGAAETLTHIALRKINGEDAQEGFVPIPSVELELNEKGVLITDDLLNQKVQTFDHLQRLNNGQFLIMGRTDDLINSGGLKIYPSQVEAIIEGHVNFEFFIKGTPDDLWGEIVTWVVKDDEDIPDNWPTWFDQTPLMRPRKIERVKELPRNKNGKWIRK